MSPAVAIDPGFADILNQLAPKKDRLSLLDYAGQMFPGYEVNYHHEVIADALERLADNEPGYENLIIIMPPRHGKSTLVTEIFPSWYLGQHPRENIIACSHTASLAETFSRRTRDMVDDRDYPFDHAVSSATSSVKEWTIEGFRGGYFAAGVGGGITGRGANILLVDDPHKTAEEAKSVTIREKIFEWYQATAQTRLEANGRQVIVATRWHRDDLIGRLIKREGRIENGGKWRVIHFPAQLEDGSYLWETRFGKKWYEDRRKSAGEYHWASQYQGDPVPEGGAIIHDDWIVTFAYPESHYEKIIQSWDTAFKEQAGSDFSVCETWGLSVSGYDLLDVYRQQVEFPALIRASKAQFQKWRPSEVLIEDRGSGTSLIQTLRKETRMNLIAVPAIKDKAQRLHDVSALFEAGRVRIAEGREWTDQVIHELTSFPFAEHDDCADSASQALARMAGVGLYHGAVVSQSYIRGEEPPDDDDPVFGRFRSRR